MRALCLQDERMRESEEEYEIHLEDEDDVGNEDVVLDATIWPVA